MINSRVFFCLTILFSITSKLNAVTQEDLSKIENVVDEDVFNEINEIFGETPKTEDKEQTIESIKPRIFGKRDEDGELGMDTLTVIWYLTTFTALFGFFVVMACTDNKCHRRRFSKPAEIRNPTPSPCPSYKHFAPPSYGSVMKKLKEQKIYIVPVHENNNFFNHPMNDTTSSKTTTTNFDIEKNETIKNSVSR
ncbi:hypothetical protein PVAND_000631 [Polypedilum vanderplanki]|uniref:Uncharacterized protein n=1 Tax=Polypedilum vanderplanki TaxID=319348 RepID=A0A9J6BKW3_POLVA|nr:hypothetical protein PVAND_000631 [Polypedilum vanderplanki]